MATPTPDNYTFTPGTPLYAGLPTPSVGGLITTLSLVNTSGSTQAANFVSPMMGVPFKQGDLPSGEYPVFTLEDDTPCPATVYNDTSWPDLSKKFCGVFFRTPTSIAGSSSLTINVNSGGSAPSASSRTLSDLTAADLKVEITGVTNLSGVWVASLNTAITDATEIIEIGDGPAGKLWRIRGSFKQSGAAHGQLECWHYVLAAENSAGGLSHLEYLPRVGQPWADVASPAPTRRVLTCVLKSGATTLLTMQGHDTTETPGSNIGMPHYSSFFVCGTDGRWNFIQGGGTTSARPTVRVLQDKTYVVKTKLVPAYDLAQSTSSSTSVNYYPQAAAGMERNMGTTGEREDIGVLTSWAVKHIINQTATDERVVRCVGLASSGWRTGLRRSTTGQIIPCTDPSASYTGLGTIQTTWRYRIGDPCTGVIQPTVETSMWNSEHEPSHRPSAAYYPYLITGEPQYMDLMVEHGANLYLWANPGVINLTTVGAVTKSTISDGSFGGRDANIAGTTYKGGGFYAIDGLIRVPAWGMRDVAQAGALYPDTCPYGTETRKYLRELCEGGFAAMNAYNAARAQPWRDGGFMNFDPRDLAEAPWCHAYMSLSVSHQAAILASTAGATMRAHLGRYWSRADELMDIANVISFRAPHYDETATRVEDMEQMAFEIGCTLTFSTSTNRFTVSGPGTGSWSPTNGDIFVFSSAQDADKPFTEATDYRRLYAVNCTGNTGQLSLTPGGSALTVTSNAVITSFCAALASFAPHLTAENFFGPQQYISTFRAAIRLHEACGDSYISTARTNIDALFAASGIVFTSIPKNAMAAAYPA